MLRGPSSLRSDVRRCEKHANSKDPPSERRRVVRAEGREGRGRECRAVRELGRGELSSLF